ncbi:uncharacterized protein LOC133800035 [Humulus lupulus]|uniref:uncharacterized protein LOC133800035 n=1 Tax=Humulus lupulus TaxID=3486 RepID=UPI002B40A66F|nr:uncharacterized protein LOC133800035 [Humulus lupulus]
MYICYAGLKAGFNEGCRPLIGLDGCHIKGVHPGQLLTTVGIDGNNQMYPIAFVVVEIENKDSWSLFLDLLKVNLKIENSNHWSFITDNQTGLEQALKGLWDEGVPKAKHRHCARHLEKNFNKVFRDKTLKDLLWKAAREVTIRRFEAVMLEIKSIIDEEAYNWLLATCPHHWSISHFRTQPKCDILVNNMCEGFNGTKSILATRDRPILLMLERIRMYMMQRLTKNRHSVIMWESNIAPRVATVLEKNKLEAGSHIPTKGSEFMYQVMNIHVIAAIWHKREDPMTYVSKWYTKEYYMKAYAQQIFPIRNQDEWPRSGKVGMIKPIGKTQLGRPKKSIRVELDELAPPTSKKLKRRYVRMRCSGCGAVGHNFRTCARNNFNSGKDNPPADPGTYDRNSSQPENASVSSATNLSALQGIMPPPQVEAEERPEILEAYLISAVPFFVFSEWLKRVLISSPSAFGGGINPLLHCRGGGGCRISCAGKAVDAPEGADPSSLANKVAKVAGP